MKEDEYFRVTHDYPVEAFRAFNEAGLRGEDGKFRFVFVSGDGADETGKSKVMFSRIKVIDLPDHTPLRKLTYWL